MSEKGFQTEAESDAYQIQRLHKCRKRRRIFSSITLVVGFLILAGIWYCIELLRDIAQDNDFLEKNMLYAGLLIGIFIGIFLGQTLSNVAGIIMSLLNKKTFIYEDLLIKYYNLYTDSYSGKE